MSICVDLADDPRRHAGHAIAIATDGAADSSPEVASIGGKARSLLRLARAGLPVPPAFAVTGRLFQALRAGGPPLPHQLREPRDLAVLDAAGSALLVAPAPAGFADELERALDRLDAGGAARLTFSVRSSFPREDQEGGLGAGVYASELDVPRAGVAAAIRRVLASALSPAAIAYAQAQGEDPAGPVGTAVLIHPFIRGRASGSAAIDPTAPTAPTAPAARAPVTIEVAQGAIDPAARRFIERVAIELGASQGAIELEWVSPGDGEVIFLQLRRYRAAPEPRAWSGASALEPGDWRWDAAHNPLPLSPAQTGLVALVESSCRVGIRQQVVGGYLFYVPRGEPPAQTIEPAKVSEAYAALEAAAERGLSALGPAPSLDRALALFVAVYQPLFGAIQPALRRCAEDLDGFLREHLSTAEAPGLALRLRGGVESIATERRRRAARLSAAGDDQARAAALGDYLARFGDESPVWDVAVPTYREVDPATLLAGARRRGDPGSAGLDRDRDDRGRDDAVERERATDGRAETDARPGAVRGPGDGAEIDADQRRATEWREAAREIAARLPAGARTSFDQRLRLARAAVAIGEADDFLYARLQAAVRAALAREGQRLAARGVLDSAADVYWLPLETVVQSARGEAPLDRARATSLLEAARAAHRRALDDPPPAPAPAPADGSPAPPPAGARQAGVVAGRRASGGRVIGRALVRGPRADAGPVVAPAAGPSNDAIILVAATLLPTELPLLRAAGLVVECGGVLGHVAAQARERGIPALVDAAGACAAIATGDLVLLDADAGQLIKLADAGPTER